MEEKNKKLPESLRAKILAVLKRSNSRYFSSKKREGVLIIKGNLIDELISESDILEAIDQGVINLWTYEKFGQYYTFIEHRSQMMPRYRNYNAPENIEKIFDEEINKSVIKDWREGLSNELQEKIYSILEYSGLKYFPSRKKKGTMIIIGNIVGQMLRENDIIDAIDQGVLNVWSSSKDGVIYSFIQHYKGMRPRFRNFGEYVFNEKRTLGELRALAEKKVERDMRHPEWYPWIRGDKIIREQEFYSSRKWIEMRGRYYSYMGSGNKKTRQCQVCGRKFEGQSSMLVDLHHVITIKNGGDNTILNLVSICIACHALVHNKKDILINGLFHYYANTGNVGNDNIRNTLVEHDDTSSAFYQQYFLYLYDRFCEECNLIEAKKYFFNRALEGYRYNNRAIFFSNYQDYMRVTKLRYGTIDNNVRHNDIVQMKILDLMISVMALEISFKSYDYYKKMLIEIGGNQNRRLEGIRAKIDELRKAIFDIKEWMRTQIALDIDVLVELAMIMKEEKDFDMGKFFQKSVYGDKNSQYHRYAIRKRNRLMCIILLSCLGIEKKWGGYMAKLMLF